MTAHEITYYLTHRFRHETPHYPMDNVEQRIFNEVSNVDLSRIQDIHNGDTRIHDLVSKVLRENAYNLRRTFEYYTSYTGVSQNTLLISDWMTFIRDMKLTDKKLTTVKLKKITENIFKSSDQQVCKSSIKTFNSQYFFLAG